ncbi:MAG: PDZ domain-containing protein, partial [Bacteroidota bacterium]
YVDSITENSAACDAGIKEGDVILEANDTEVKTTSKLLEIIGRHHPGDKVSLKVDRKGKELDYQVTLRNREGKEKIYERGTKEILDILGIDLEEIDKETARKLDIDGGLRITKLGAGKLKRQTDIRVGFIITHVNKKTVRTIDQFVNMLEDKKGGVMVEGIYEDYPGRYYYAFGL